MINKGIIMIGALIVLGTIILLTYGIYAFKEYKAKKSKVNMSFKEAMDLAELPVVTFYSGDEKLNFLLDTGSNNSLINSAVLKKLNAIPLNYITTVTGAGGKSETYSSFYEVTISYKNKAYKIELGSVDLEGPFNQIKQETGVQIHGILGSKFFKKYKYILDFNELIAYSKK